MTILSPIWIKNASVHDNPNLLSFLSGENLRFVFAEREDAASTERFGRFLNACEAQNLDNGFRLEHARRDAAADELLVRFFLVENRDHFEFARDRARFLGQKILNCFFQDHKQSLT